MENKEQKAEACKLVPLVQASSTAAECSFPTSKTLLYKTTFVILV